MKLVDTIVHMEMPVNLTKHGKSTMECVASERVALNSLTLDIKVFKRIDKQLPQLTTLDLQYVSPSLLKARNLDLAVPGISFVIQEELDN